MPTLPSVPMRRLNSRHDERWGSSGLRAKRSRCSYYRDSFLVQLYFAHTLPPEQLDALLAEQARLHEERLAVYRAVPLPTLDELKGQRDHLAQRLTLELGLALEQAQLDWIARAREALAADAAE